LRFLAWCVERRVYRLSALTPEDLEAFSQALRPDGWASALGLGRRLDHTLECARADRAVLEALVSVKHGVGFVSPEVLSRQIGVLVTSREYPEGFTSAMAALAGAGFRGSKRRSAAGWSQSSFKTCFVALNRLAFLPDTLDRLSFEPFKNSREQARESGGRPDGRTLNLPIEDAAKLLRLALRWVYVRGPGVVELVRIWRQALSDGGERWGGKADIQTFVVQQLREAYPALQAKHELPEMTSLQAAGAGDSSVVGLVEDLQTAVMVIVGINQARRKNEVLGEGSRPWGLYHGCLQLADPIVDAYELDIYIEKTWRDWLRMSANKLTVDAIGILEELQHAMFPGVDEASLSIQERRARKLFVLPSHRVLTGEDADPHQYSFDSHSRRFFDEAGIADALRRTHPFRRLFALIYTYRWDHPSLQALSEHLCHLDMECTRLYVTDDAMRAQAETIEQVYRMRADCLPQDELDEAQRQYADDLLQAMLTSPQAGGPMTRRVRLWVRRLSRRVEFADADLATALGAVRGDIERRAYLPTAFRHGACWANHPRHAGHAHCGKDGQLHRELAGIDVCRTCPFHSTSSAFLQNIEKDAGALEARMAQADDADEREALRANALRLRELIGLEYELMAGSLPAHTPTGEGSST
jgi:hypothetical protein